jgi:hypothetical protein
MLRSYGRHLSSLSQVTVTAPRGAGQPLSASNLLLEHVSRRHAYWMIFEALAATSPLPWRMVVHIW